MEKIILIFYFKKEEIDKSPEVISRFLNDLKTQDILGIAIPTDGDNLVECVNPKMVSDEEYQKVKELVVKVKQDLENQLKK